MNITLRTPAEHDAAAVTALLDALTAAGSDTDGFWNSADTFIYANWLAACREAAYGRGLPEGFVPYIQYVMFDGGGQAIGFLNLRLRLNDFLREIGGHIGYCVHPAQRGKGYAKQALRQAISESRRHGIGRLLVTCRSSNPASRRVILANGGVFEDTRNGIERYWIDTAQAA